MIIQHNIAALNSYRQLSGNNSALARNLEKLSSGYRINRAGDDAAGLAISEKMRAQIKGLETASKNAQDGISLIQTAEGALTEVHSMLNRMVELATQSSNGIYDDQVDRKALDDEFQALKSEIDRISQATNFNGKNLLDGTLSAGGSGSTASSGTNKISSDLAGVMKFGQSTPIAATTACYQVDAANVDTFLSGFGTDSGQGEAVIAAKLGIDANKYNITFDSGNMVISAKKAGVDSGKEALFLIGKTGSNDGAIFEIQAGKDSYRELTIKIDEDEANDTALIGKSFTINGKTYQFTGQSDKDEDDNTAVNGATLANGNFAVMLATNANGTTSAYAGETATQIAAAINAVEMRANDTTAASYTGTKDEIAFGNQSSSSSTAYGTGSTKNGTIAFNVASKYWNGGGASTGGSGGLSLQIGDTADKYNIITVGVEDMSTKGLGIAGLNIASYDTAVKALGTIAQQGEPGTIKGAINVVSAQRATLGALQNRLEHTINNLGVTTENLTAAEARIRDTDMAKEMMNYTKNNILVQAAQAMLAQANSIPQGVLQLLR